MRFRGTIALALMLLMAPVAEAEDGAMDKDLIEVSIPQLQKFYADRKYTIAQVVDWYLARIDRYNGVYRAYEQIYADAARAEAARQDSDKSAGHGPLWGVPIVVKSNTSIQGMVTTAGWDGFTVPGHELVAPRDATVVAKLKAAGAIILGHSNMPDFANSDTTRSSSYGRTGNAYDVRFSPGGSSGGTVTAVSGNMAMLGTGTDTGNSIRMPAGTSALVGVFPTRGLVSIAGITPLDWLLDNTGPISRNVTDAAITLSVMQGEDPLDPPTAGTAAKAQPGPYTRYLKTDALKGKRFGVPYLVMSGVSTPFHGVPANVSELDARKAATGGFMPLDPRTKAAFLKALDELRAQGASIVIDDSILGEDFAKIATRVGTYPYVREGTDLFLKDFGTKEFKSSADYDRLMGKPLYGSAIGTEPANNIFGDTFLTQKSISSPDYAKDVLEPRKRALDLYVKTMDRLKLDGYVYPAIQMPPVDETMPQNGTISGGPHSATAWVNMIGVPAIVVTGGFYDSGLPFGLEFAGRPFHDGDLLGFAYAWEQATHHRRPPALVERGLLPDAR